MCDTGSQRPDPRLHKGRTGSDKRREGGSKRSEGELFPPRFSKTSPFSKMSKD